VIKQYWGIHGNDCTEVAMQESIFCESCAKQYFAACEAAKDASEKLQNRSQRILSKLEGKGAHKHE